MNNLLSAFGLRTSPIVFVGSAALIFAFAIFGTVFSESAGAVFAAGQQFITTTFGWLYNGAMTFFLGFAVWLAASRYGRIRLGDDQDRPKYSYMAWFAMLFSAGMGIGVLFWSVAEPVTHYMRPPFGTPESLESAQLAMNISLLQWGLHGWGVYVIVGLTLAYCTFRLKLPLSLRSALHPLFGDRINGGLGHAIDIFAVLGTMFGVATTLGLGAQQISAGLHHLTGLTNTTAVHLTIIAVITLMATVSVVSGIDKGIKYLSMLAIWLALGLILYVLFTGPTTVALRSTLESSGHYLLAMAKQFFWSNLGGDDAWQGDWTLFYWGWWIAWSPFVGIFVARISQGRTIREFILGVLLVPALTTAVWFSIFGGIAMHRVTHGDTALTDAVLNDVPVSIYVFFSGFPLSGLLSVVGVIVIVVFFVTSSDSASLVIDYLTSGGDLDPPRRQRVFWASIEGVVAAVLLLTGGLAPMRAFQVMTGLPLCIILLLMCVALVRALRAEKIPAK
jgi:choline/glycine/proline betaine transport protein